MRAVEKEQVEQNRALHHAFSKGLRFIKSREVTKRHDQAWHLITALRDTLDEAGLTITVKRGKRDTWEQHKKEKTYDLWS
jgi:hypothetical protein